MIKLTKFEKTRILSARALQINDGATAYVKSPKENTLDLSQEEFKENRTPLKVIRK
jgi:DNA-directed RNA polymerase subunit K/omega